MAGTPDDELLRPTLSERSAPVAGAEQPWRLGSQVYVAFFGGALAVAAVAGVNARRLGMDRVALALIAGLGLAGLGGTVALALAVDDLPAYGRRAVALAAWGGMWLLQRSPDRSFAYHARAEEPYASLWWPGLAAVLAGGALQGLVVYAITGDVA
jgi:hypothetical protein